MITAYMKVSVLNLTAFGLCHIKDISFKSAIKDTLKTVNNPELGDFQHFKTNNKWLFLPTYDEVKNGTIQQYAINDEMDVCVKIQEILEDD